MVGATGRLRESTDNPDGTRTFASSRRTSTTSRGRPAGASSSGARGSRTPATRRSTSGSSLQPEHAHLAERYLDATKIALRTYGTWSAPYPYAQITVVDPAYGSASGGMEYPTLFTGGASVLAPPELQSPEGVTIHEAGHQFWYGLVATNEFEEAWLDEGFNTYMTSKATDHSLGPEGWGRRYFGAGPGRGGRVGWPVVAPGVRIPRGSDSLAALREGGEADVMARKAWTYRDGGSYGLNSYGKPALVMQTLEGLLGEETMVRVLRT